MNRIILIGNGFDLAHKMKTSYNHFLDDYWERTVCEIREKEYGNKFENDEILIRELPFISFQFSNKEVFNQLRQERENEFSKMEFKNYFFEHITDMKNLQNWVDIENEYYSLLKKCNSKYDVTKLNSDFENVKNLLKKYLLEVKSKFNRNDINERIIRKINNFIFESFKIKDFREESINHRVEIEFNKIYKDIVALREGNIDLNDLRLERRSFINNMVSLNDDYVRQYIRKQLFLNDEYFKLYPKNTLLLNFNYTDTEFIYENIHSIKRLETNLETIHIHGTLFNDNNPIIFGYGDEIDEDYKSIENLNDNEYFENIKSFKYLETDNYKKLLNFINLNNYQVLIFGHSCGISDRTLLNTIFEHQNCVSIKPYYHQKTEPTDNYSEIIKNISRNFNDKVEMRNKVVNKMYCEPMT